MRWMKFTDAEGDTVWINMAHAESFYRDGDLIMRIVTASGANWVVKDAPEEIVARGQWEVR